MLLGALGSVKGWVVGGGGGEEVSTPDRLVRTGKTHDLAKDTFPLCLLSAGEPQHGMLKTFPQLDEEVNDSTEGWLMRADLLRYFSLFEFLHDE